MLISVILPAYNAERTIAEAIESILNQTCPDFELIIINDGSSDRTEKVILSYRDPRIRYYSNPGNQGLIYTLNRGIGLANGKYLARMDADDISLPTRFEKQLQIMETCPEIVVCGTCIKGFGHPRAQKYKFCSKETSRELKAWLIKYPSFAHPTVMIRKSILEEHNVSYDRDFPSAEDYKLWVDLSEFGEFYNIQEVLLMYRLSETQVTQPGNKVQMESSRKCRRVYVTRVWGEQLGKQIEQGHITTETVRRVPAGPGARELKEVLYMSLAKYGIREWLYFFASFDFLRFDIRVSLAILKRFVRGKKPVI